MTTCVDIINTLSPCLVRAGWNADVANLLSLLLGVVIVATVPLLTVILLIWIERKFAARIQDRIGPNRVGPYGLLQSLADALKMLTKEDITPSGADRILFNLAPIITFATVVLIWAIIPFTPLHIGADLSIGILYFVAVGSIGAVKVMIGGWSSNNKYALLGAFRTIALIVSYEVPMILALLVPVLMAGSMGMQDLTRAQGGMWFIVMSPLAAIIFFVANLAETGRSPFDLLEAESELIAGYNIEYSGFKFGMFMAGEFMHVFTVAVLTAVLFLGGWWGPFVDQLPALGFIWLGLKTAVVYLFMLLIRNTVPRFRIDQVMNINWKFMVPLSIVLILVQSFLLRLIDALGLRPAPEMANDLLANLPQTLVLLAGNLVLGAIFMHLLQRHGRTLREADEALAVVKGEAAPSGGLAEA
ncbi:MAG: NADH-quinone oxidoreductase subunit NuoH [Anaerolineaceae bacterium]|nr:NADH-quinone oxidoreductase subunit NuoH [Anaerolineaceae bacterium]MDE0329135.1 NADH-quinone oxidoreductase subunit NuoH [Anaerolineaceae bacterium]